MTFGVRLSGSKNGAAYTEQDVAAVRGLHERIAAVAAEFREANPSITLTGSVGVPALPGGTYENLPV